MVIYAASSPQVVNLDAQALPGQLSDCRSTRTAGRINVHEVKQDETAKRQVEGSRRVAAGLSWRCQRWACIRDSAVRAGDAAANVSVRDGHR